MSDEQEFNNDVEFTENRVTSVRESETHYQIECDGWWLGIPKVAGVVPVVGSVARLYGKGSGCTVRGVLIDGKRVYYRTAEQEKEHREIEMYGADAKDWLGRWDAGRTVWSIEMGGLGPGYEQAIQVAAAEVLRHILEKGYVLDDSTTDEGWRSVGEEIRNASFANPVIRGLGLSGAQYGAAVNIAMNLHRRGPRAIFNDERVKDRMIQVSKNFPGATVAPGGEGRI